MTPEALNASDLQSSAALIQASIQSWQITRHRFRPTFKDRFIDLASIVPGLVEGPKMSFRERHVQLFPHLLAMDVVVSPGMYAVRHAESSGQPISSADLEMLTRRLWHTQGARLCTELADSELRHWNQLGTHGLTFNIEPISPHLETQA